MSERFRERLGYLSEELEGHLRSTSPSGSRSPRRASRSPRPNTSDSIAVAIPQIRDSRPEIAAWPAPPAGSDLANPPKSNATTTATVQSMSTPSPSALSPASPIMQIKSVDHYEDTTTLLTMLKVAAATSGSGLRNVPRGRETELKRKIQTLEETVAEYERQKFNVMGTFSEYRERVVERERKLEAEYSSKIIFLSEEVLGAKKDFEIRMKSFQALQDKFEREKEQALEKLRKEHQKEIQLLEQRFSESQLLNLEQKYMIEIQRLEEERKSLRSEKERLGETFEMKLRRAQSLYETELTAAKMLYTKELEALRDHEDALKEELLARQDEFHDRLQELQHHAKRSRDELASCKNEVTSLEKKLQRKESEVQAISKELDEARAETNDSLMKVSQSTSQYTEHRQQFQQQEDELRKKSRLLSVVESAKSKLEELIRDLQSEVKALKNKVEFLEKERDNLQSQSESQAQLQNSQVDALEAVLESVTKEKENTKEHYEGLLLKEKQQAEAREHAMKKEFSCKLNELEEQYTSLKEDLEHSARMDQHELRETTQQEIMSLRTEKTLLEAEILALKQKFLNEDCEQDEVVAQLSDVIEKTAELTKSLDDYRLKIQIKDEELSKLRNRLEEEQCLSENQLEVLREDLRKEMLNSEEYTRNLHENEQLHSRIAEYERQIETEQETVSDQIKQLRQENEKLLNKLKEMQDKNDDATVSGEHIEELKTILKERDSQIDALKKKVDESCSESDRSDDLERKLQELQIGNEEKTSQIERLHVRVKELMDQVGSIKNELEKKNEIIQQITESNGEEPISADSRLDQLKKEHEETISELKRNQQRLVKDLEEARASTSADESYLVEQDHHLNEREEIIRKREADLEAAKEESLLELAQREELLLNKENNLKTKEVELIQLKEEMKADLDKREDHLKNKEEELKSREDELSEPVSMQVDMATETNFAYIQTDPIETTPPVTIIDLAKEKELKLKIEHLEKALERKNELIQQLQERIPDELDDMPRKKDRSQSVTSGVFQNFVSQMKDKRDEANEKSKRKEAERKAEKAAKEAAKEIIKERSPMRSKSPSLLNRLRDRSPRAKSPNLETTPSTSSRNLLSPIDAERSAERRGSPSRALFGRKKDKEPYSPNEKAVGSERRPAWKF